MTLQTRSFVEFLPIFFKTLKLFYLWTPVSDLDPIWTKLQVIGGAGQFGHVPVVVGTPHKAPDAVVWCLKVADIVREAGSTKKKNLTSCQIF